MSCSEPSRHGSPIIVYSESRPSLSGGVDGAVTHFDMQAARLHLR